MYIVTGMIHSYAGRLDVGGQFFRNWAPEEKSQAGMWHRDEIRNITGMVNTGATIFEAAEAFSVVTGSPEESVGGFSGASDFDFDASRTVPTGPENVPPHVWQPLVIYLGRPAQV